MRTVPLRRTLAAAVVALAVAGQAGARATSEPAAAAQQAAQPAAQPAAAVPAAVTEIHRVTLVTGDVAELEVRADGTERARLVQGSGYHAFVEAGDAYLVPAEAQPLLGSDRLDLALFNVSGLVEQGYDDGLPLILSYRSTPGSATRSAAKAPAGSERRAVLDSINAIAVDTRHDDADQFWDAVAGDADRTQRPLLAGNVDKIWLDAQVQSTLDESAAQIGAPAAWSRGLTGEGARIAVLDSGIDSSHADFDDRIVDTRDFTGGDSVGDGLGHGTHVASIAAGSGAASDGTYRGIAPDATLMVGKVLGDDGSGSTSAAIEGMEWAAAGGADVVNLSLGGPVTRGDDPMSEAVNRLTAQHDVLFVVSAGNYSPWVPEMEYVTSPAAADSALAVGALRTPTSLWTSSRRGRMGGGAIKPEIVAPGFTITAAGSSAAGLPSYVSMTGTSMAAPHVAGAAAVLKQQHPDWGAAELRDVLTSTTGRLAHGTVYEHGAGRADLDRATAQDVFVDSGLLHMGDFTRPYEPDELTVTKTLTYRNTSATEVTLDLTTALTAGRSEDPVDGVLTVEPTTLTLPAGGSGEVAVSVDATDAEAETYSGRVTARSGDLELGTTVGFAKQGDLIDVTLRAVDRDGGPGTATIRISPYKDFDGRYFPDYIYLSDQQREHTVRLPEGDYSLWSLVTTFDESGRFAEEESIVGDPKLEVRPPNFEVTLDARDAEPVSLQTPLTSIPRALGLSWWRGDNDSERFTEDTWSWSFNDGEPEKVSVAATERVDDAPFVLSTSWDAGPAPLLTQWRGQTLDAVQVAGADLVDGRRSLTVVDAGRALPSDLTGKDLHGKVALVQETDQLTHTEQATAVVEAGAEVVALYSAYPGVFWPNRVTSMVPVLALPRDQGEALRAGTTERRVVLDLHGTPRASYAYDVSFAEDGQVPDRLDYRVKPKDLAEVTANIYTTGTHERGWRLHQSARTDCDCGSPYVEDFVPSTGYTRTEYVSARPGLQTISAWLFLFGRPADILFDREETAYAPHQKATEDWLKAPLSPGLAQTDLRIGGVHHAVRRTGDWLSYALAGFTDSAGHWLSNFSVMSEQSRLFRNGEQVHAAGNLRGSVKVPAESGTYRLEADVTHDGSWIGLSTESHTAWTFESTNVDAEQILPLIDVDYTDLVDARTDRPALDLANTAPGGQSVRLVLDAAHQMGSQAGQVDEATVRVSYDDGETWTDAEVSADGNGRFGATYRHPAASTTSGYVSLQVELAGADGGRLEQTLIRAYRLS
ncbi:MAG: S8 family peptidase [Nocardioidaceae bacterium]